jgi:hypothetical protein
LAPELLHIHWFSFSEAQMKLGSIAFFTLLMVLAAASPRATEASRVVITAPDPSCGTPETIIFPLILVSGVPGSCLDFTWEGRGSLVDLGAIVHPTLNTAVTCGFAGTAFDNCIVLQGTVPPDDDWLMSEMGMGDTLSSNTALIIFECNSGDCTPLIDGQGGQVTTPEPTEAALLFLGLGVSFIGLGGRRRWKAIGSN